MPWNEPGNSSKNKDPWTGRPKQTPPDLEAFLRDLCKKIVALFKLKALNKTNTAFTKAFLPTQLNAKLLGLIFSFFVLTWLFSGFFTVAPSEKAVITLFGKYDTTLSPGRHWIFRPIAARTIISEKSIPYSYQISLLTRDKNKISISAKIHYSIANPRQYLFSNTHPLPSLEAAIATASNQILGQFSLEELLSANLYSLQETLHQQIDKQLTSYSTGLSISTIELQPIQVPEDLKASFEALDQAQTKKEQLESQAKNYAMQILPQSQLQAEKLIADAKIYQQEVILKAKAETTRFLALLPAYEASPLLTRKRLYSEAMQVMMLNSNKMLIDNPSSIALYINSDKAIIKGQEKTTRLSSKKSTAESITAETLAKPAKTNDTLASSYNITGGYE